MIVAGRFVLTRTLTRMEGMNLLCCRRTPIVWSRDGESSSASNHVRDKHGLAPRKHCLAKSMKLTTQILDSHSTSARGAVRLIRKRFADCPRGIAIETTILQWISMT